MKKFLLATAALVTAPAAFAGSVDFKVAPVSITIEAKNFKLALVEASLRCHFEDGSGIFEAYPTKQLKAVVTELPAETEGSTLYRVDVGAGRLKAMKLFADLRACTYQIFVKAGSESTNAAWTTVNLAGTMANMTRQELKDVVEDPSLADRISTHFQPLVLEEDGMVLREIR